MPIPGDTTTTPVTTTFLATLLAQTTTTTPALSGGRAGATPDGTSEAKNSATSSLQAVKRIRQKFPESWIWTEVVSG